MPSSIKTLMSVSSAGEEEADDFSLAYLSPVSFLECLASQFTCEKVVNAFSLNIDLMLLLCQHTGIL